MLLVPVSLKTSEVTDLTTPTVASQFGVGSSKLAEVDAMKAATTREKADSESAALVASHKRPAFSPAS